MSLIQYNKKRDFKKTGEPKGKRVGETNSMFVVQKHHASHLHYDFRLEIDGVLKSWAVPKGPSLDPKQKRLAVQVEDHPVEYGDFEGEIPKGEYGGGHVIVWDTGRWKEKSKSALADWKKGRLEFELFGEKLRGKWVLIRTRGSGSRQWLLIKRTDEEARSGREADVTALEPASVLSAKTIEEMQGQTPKASARAKKTARKAASNSTLDFVKPQLAQLQNQPPSGSDWAHEIKFDGYRTLARVQGKEVTLYTRSGLDWTEKYGELAGEFASLKTRGALIDGEIVAVNEQGRSDFHTLQAALKSGETDRLIFYAFDLLALDGKDLREESLEKRKEQLLKLVEKSGKMRSSKILFSEHWETDAKDLLSQSCRLGLEGIISKRLDAPYSSGRTGDWVKSKCGRNEEFVIGGFTKPKGSRTGFGALVLGAFDKHHELRYVGRVGTGFDDAAIKAVLKRMKPLEVDESPFEGKIPEASSITWIKPKLVAQIKFAELTADGLIRHGSFIDLREDKPAREVELSNTEAVDLPARKKSRTRSSAASRATDEASTSATAGSKLKSGAAVAGVKISHPDREVLVDDKGGLTKFELASFYELVAPRMLGDLSSRPLSLLRCPDGVGQECFFQKHLVSGKGSAVHDFKRSLKERPEKEVKGVFIDSAKGLVGLVQMGVIEVHAWGCHLDEIERPDALVFDLDPDEKVEWPRVIEGAHAIRSTLDDLKLKSFLKVTGGKGLHIHVPIDRKYTWDEVKLFTKTISAQLVRKEPALYTTDPMKKKRAGKIFIDYLRNGYGATAIAPYSVRAREGAPVAVPIAWAELKRDLNPAQFKMREAAEWLKKRKKDPWADYKKVQQSISILDELGSRRKKR